MDTQAQRQRTIDARPAGTMNLLLPVDATERSRWGISYAIRRKQSGHHVAASLLFVAETVTSWQVLRFLTQEEVRRFQMERGNNLLEDAAQPLERAGIPAQMNYREGDIAFHILDVAEQLDCHEIVLPIPRPQWASLFAVDIVREVIRRQPVVPVTTVNPQGMPDRSWHHCRSQPDEMTIG